MTGIKVANANCQEPTLAIVGAGILGRLLAWRLSEAGFKVTLFNEENLYRRSSCSWAAAGMLAPYCELARSEVELFEPGLFSLVAWEKITRLLKIPACFEKKGSLVVADAAMAGDAEHFLLTIQQKIAGHKTEVFEVSELFAKEWREFRERCDLNSANLANVNINTSQDCGINSRYRWQLLFDYEGHVHAQPLMQTLATYLGDKVEVVIGKVDQIQPPKLSFNMDSGSQIEEREFDWVFDCRGIGAESDIDRLRAVRGEALHIRCPDVKLERPIRVLHPRYPLYIVPRGDGEFFIGATEIESNDQRRVTARSAMELLSTLYALNSAFAEAEIISFYRGLRPAFDDNLPAVNWQDGLVKANGLYRHGYLLAPFVVEQIYSRLCHEIEDKVPYKKESFLWKSF